MKVGDGVLIDASALGLHGGQLVGVVEEASGDVFCVALSRRIERAMVWGEDKADRYPFLYFFPDEITATIPNQGHWLGKEMP